MYLNASYVRNHLPVIGRTFHKFDRGRLFLCAGSYGMAGAAILAGKAALRTGVGYLDLCVPRSIYEIVTTALPEAVFSVYDENDPEAAAAVISERAEKADAVAVGPGLGPLRTLVTEAALHSNAKRVLLDADALNHIAGSYDPVPERETLLTPHEGEASRLLGIAAPSIRADRQNAAIDLSARYQATVLLKGPETIIVSPGDPEPFINVTANAALATAGSGDVLTGIAGSLFASGLDAKNAGGCAAFLHGLTSIIAADRLGLRSARALDFIAALPEAIRSVEEAESAT